MIFLLKFGFYSLWAKCVEFPLPTVLLVDSQPRRAHYFAKQSIVGYTLLNSRLFCFAFFSKFFSTIYIEKHSWKNIFNLYPISFFCLLLFVLLYVFALTNPRKINYLSILYGHLQAVLRGCFAKVFYSLTIIGKFRAVCRGISRKFYKKIAENFFSTIAYKKEVLLLRLPHNIYY